MSLRRMRVVIVWFAVAACSTAQEPKPEPEPDAGPPPMIPGLVVSQPEVIGVLVGPGATHPLGALRIYGTDLGFTFEHEGEYRMMFGDTLKSADSICDEQDNDDSLATIPSEYAGGVPELQFM